MSGPRMGLLSGPSWVRFKYANLDQITTPEIFARNVLLCAEPRLLCFFDKQCLKTNKLGPDNNQPLKRRNLDQRITPQRIYIYIYAHTCAVKPGSGPIWAILMARLCPNHSCTRLRGHPVSLHVLQQISSESWGFSGAAAVLRYIPPLQGPVTAASEKASRYRGV